MSIKVGLDLEGFSVNEHREVIAAVRELCTGTDIEFIEMDERSRRHVDPASIGAVAGVVSAVCAVIALTLRVCQSRAERSARRPLVESAVADVERRANLELPADARSALIEGFESSDAAKVKKVSLTLLRKEYRVTIYEESGEFLLKGRFHHGQTKR